VQKQKAIFFWSCELVIVENYSASLNPSEAFKSAFTLFSHIDFDTLAACYSLEIVVLLKRVLLYNLHHIVLSDLE